MPVAGEAEVADAAVFLLLHEIVVDAVLRVEILLDVQLAHVVEQVEIKILHAAFLELLLKDLLDLRHVAEVVAGEFCGQIVALARVGRERLAHGELGVAVVIAPRRVVIVDAVFHRVGDHVLQLRGVDVVIALFRVRQAHAAKAQPRQLFLLKCFVDHMYLPFL